MVDVVEIARITKSPSVFLDKVVLCDGQGVCETCGKWLL